MFFEIEIEHQLKLEPTFLAKGTSQTIEKQLKNQKEGQFMVGKGLILKIIKIVDIGKGRVSVRTGCASYNVKFKALVLRPYEGLVIDAKVSGINEYSVMANAGPLNIAISAKLMRDYDYDPETLTYKHKDGNKTISIKSIVRLRIISAVPHKDQKRISATATINGEHLGILA